MASINSHINPFSSGFQSSAENFTSLSAGSKILTIFFSAVAFLVSLPLLGIGGFATFRSLVDRLSPVDHSHSKTIAKTTKVAEDTLGLSQRTGARARFQKAHAQQKVIDELLSDIESELKTLNDYLSSKSIQEKLDKALANKEALDDRRACLRDLASFYNTYHREINESLKTIESLGKDLKNRSKKKIESRLRTIKSDYDKLGTLIHADLATKQAKIAKVFILVHSGLQKDMDEKLPTLDQADLKEYEAIADFLHGMFSRINSIPDEQRDISEIQKLETDQYTGILPFIGTFFAYLIRAGTQADPKSKVHETVVEPIEAWRKKIRGEIDKREVARKRISAALHNTLPAKGSNRLSPRSSQTINPGGLPNLGNTCYMNSSIQVILNTPSLSAFIDRDIPEPVWSDFSDVALDDRALANYLSGAAQPEEASLRSAVNKYQEAIEDYPRKNSHLKAFRQLKDVYEGRNTSIPLRSAVSHLRSIVTGIDTRLVDLPQTFSQQDAGEFMTAALRGIGYSFTLRKTIQSTDSEHTSTIDEPQTYLSIPIVPKMRGKVTFQELIDAYRTEETDDPQNVWKVTDTDNFVIAEHQKYTSTLSIVGKIPDTLVIQLKRFDRSGGISKKISNPVEIGEEVDMRSMIDSTFSSTRYRVKGVVVHSGSINGGHYTADVKIEDKWQYRSDDYVNPNPTANSIASDRENGYLYVLERIK